MDYDYSDLVAKALTWAEQACASGCAAIRRQRRADLFRPALCARDALGEAARPEQISRLRLRDDGRGTHRADRMDAAGKVGNRALWICQPAL